MRGGCKQRAKHCVWANWRITQRVSATGQDVNIRKTFNAGLCAQQNEGQIEDVGLKPKEAEQTEGSNTSSCKYSSKVSQVNSQGGDNSRVETTVQVSSKART